MSTCYSKEELTIIDAAMPGFVNDFLTEATRQAQHVRKYGVYTRPTVKYNINEEELDDVATFTRSIPMILPYASSYICVHVNNVLKEYHLNDATTTLESIKYDRIGKYMEILSKTTLARPKVAYFFQRTPENKCACIELQRILCSLHWIRTRSAFSPAKHRVFRTLPSPNPRIGAVALWGVATRGCVILSTTAPSMASLSIRIADIIQGKDTCPLCGNSLYSDRTDDPDDIDLDKVVDRRCKHFYHLGSCS